MPFSNGMPKSFEADYSTGESVVWSEAQSRLEIDRFLPRSRNCVPNFDFKDVTNAV